MKQNFRVKTDNHDFRAARRNSRVTISVKLGDVLLESEGGARQAVKVIGAAMQGKDEMLMTVEKK